MGDVLAVFQQGFEDGLALGHGKHPIVIFDTCHLDEF
jgi:hypothetical protein